MCSLKSGNKREIWLAIRSLAVLSLVDSVPALFRQRADSVQSDAKNSLGAYTVHSTHNMGKQVPFPPDASKRKATAAHLAAHHPRLLLPRPLRAKIIIIQWRIRRHS
jgi:hypothetical protein